MFDKPTSDKQSDRKQDSQNREPISPSPPKSEQEAYAQNYTGDFARDNVEATEDEQCADQGGPKIASRERQGADASSHVGYTDLMRIERDGHDFSSSATCHECV